MKKLLFNLTLIAGLALSASCSALTLAQPEYLGSIREHKLNPDTRGGIITGVKLENAIRSTEPADVRIGQYDGRTYYVYHKGIATFGRGNKEIKINYAPVSVVSSNGKNAPMMHQCEINYIGNHNDVQLFAIWHFPGHGPEGGVKIIGKRTDGVIMTYADTYELSNRYYNAKYATSSNMKGVSINGKNILINYTTYGKQQMHGRYILTWDEQAQWFGVKNEVIGEHPGYPHKCSFCKY